MRDWDNDIVLVKKKEDVFRRDFLEYLNIGYVDVSNDPEYQKKDVDILANELRNIDVKSLRGHKKPLTIPIEEVSVADGHKNIQKRGWVYESHADYFAFVCTTTRTMLVLKNNVNFKTWWDSNRDRYEDIWQSTKNGNVWYSMHKNVPVNDVSVAWYRKNNI